MNRTITLVFAVLLILSISAFGASERPSLLGFAPAYPADSLPAFTGPNAYPRPGRTHAVEVLLEVSKKGKVTGMVAADSSDRYLVDYARAYLSELDFVPAERNGKKVDSKLPLWATFGTRRSRPEIAFAIDRGAQVTDRARYFEAVEANGIVLPALRNFPSYFEEVHSSDTLKPYPFVLLKLTLDPEGRPTAIDTVLSTQPGRAMTTASAALWADYAPATVDGKPVASDCYLLVSYFPQVVYPTRRWTPGRPDSIPAIERCRVALFADTVGLMAKPIPRRLPGSSLSLREARGIGGTVSAVFAVDTSGAMRASAADVVSRSVWSVLRLMAKRMAFYPARDYQGRPRFYSGPVRLIFDGSEKVRIEYVW